MRPRAILMFERLYGLSILVAAIADALTWPMLVAALARIGMGVPLVLLSLAVGLGIPLLLLWLVARRGSAVARGIAVILTALGLLGFLFSIVRGYGAGFGTIFDAARLALQVVALFFTYRPDARAWFWPAMPKELP
jgi:hypothetical protein